MGKFKGKLTRRSLRLLGLLAVQLVVAALLLETVVRVVGPRTAMRQLLYQPAAAADFEGAQTLEQLLQRSMIGFAPFTKSYGFVLNSRSLRTKEYAVEKPPGITRVLAFGDSFTWASGGLPHKQHWTVILEDRLRRTSGSQIEVLRFGVPATGPDFQHRLWQLEGVRLEPDLVVVGFFIGNDFVDHQGIEETKNLSDHSLIELIADDWMSLRLAHNLYRVARGVTNRHRSATTSDDDGGIHPDGGYPIRKYKRHFRPDRPTFTPTRFLEIEARRMALCRDDNEADFEVLLDRVGATLSAFNREVEDLGARFVVMIIPDEYRVDPTLAAAVAESEGFPLDAYDLDRPARRLKEYLSKRRIEHLDVTPEFVRFGTEVSFYRVRDTHWNYDGNKLASELLAGYLTGGGAGAYQPVNPTSISANDFEKGEPDGFRTESLAKSSTMEGGD